MQVELTLLLYSRTDSQFERKIQILEDLLKTCMVKNYGVYSKRVWDTFKLQDVPPKDMLMFHLLRNLSLALDPTRDLECFYISVGLAMQNTGMKEKQVLNSLEISSD